jgi:hypothetical protein
VVTTLATPATVVTPATLDPNLGWRELPSGMALHIQPGNAYAVVASVKVAHSKDAILRIAANHGLTVTDYAEEGQRAGLGPDPDSPGYRYIAVTAVASAANSLPWAAPWPVSIADSSHIVRAWEGSARALVVPPLAKQSVWPTVALVAVAAAGVGALAWAFWPRGSMWGVRENPSGAGGNKSARGAPIVKGRSCLFEMVEGPDVHCRGAMVHDPTGRKWPKNSVLCGPFRARVRRATDEEYRGAARDYLGTTHHASIGIVNTPPKSLAGWRYVGEVERIYYTRTGRKRPGRYQHEFFKPTALATLVRGRHGKVRLYRRGSFCRLELPRGAQLDNRGYVYP